MPQGASLVRVILAAVVGLGLAIAILSVASARFGPGASMTTAQMFDGTAVNSEIAIAFTDRMRVRSVERSFEIEPRTPGSFNWTGNTLLYTPRRPLAYGTRYTVSVGTSAMDVAGRHLFHRFTQHFTTQQEHLLYLGTSGSERHRLIFTSVSGKRRVVGQNDGSISDFSVSFDRTLVVYTRRGAPGERTDEIWLLSLADGSMQRLVREPEWNIAQPQLSPDGKTVAFLATNVVLCRKYYGCYHDVTSPIIELLDLRSHHPSAFHSATDTPITSFLDFSPAGQLAYTDLGSALTLADPNGTGVIHIPNRGNSLEFVGFDPAGDKAAFVGQTADSTGGDILVYNSRKSGYIDVSHGIYDASAPAFSQSGKQIAYAAYRSEVGIEPVYGINVYDFATRRTRHVTSPDRHSDWDPQWSPDDRYLAFVRSEPQEAMYMGAGRIWISRSNGHGARPLAGTGEDVLWVS